MSKLYEVQITCYVMAENETDAKCIAVKDCQESDAEAYVAESVDSEWFTAIPYGEKQDRLCGNLLQLQLG